VDHDGRVLAQAEPGPGERIVVGPVDVGALRAERERRRGHQMLAHLRIEAYRGYSGSVYPPGTGAAAGISVASNEAAIRKGRHPAGGAPGPV
jgi:hypothetical protein